ncbi:MAG TPA: (Fe-S)-binding protein [Polyangiaceae bacterium]|jgi:Fe-S oxidoreductase|nr:(Fe-S)-binding protein [Polyangiaceae bacterium]
MSLGSRSPSLPLLPSAQKALETCGYCPKLCRSTCPVSNQEAREALIPWGKMSSSWLVARGDLEADRDTAETSWGCSGCHACTSFCEHKNPVADTLYAARATYRDAGLAPSAVVESERRHGLRVGEAGNALSELSREPGVRPDARTALLVGCAYLRKARPEARAILRSVLALVGPVRLVPGCCGAPLLHAGDHAGFEAARARVVEATRGVHAFVVGDPGCALVLTDARPLLFVQLVAAHADELAKIPGFGESEAVRFHDPCALGRGLSEYDAPRVVLGRALGRRVDEFDSQRERAECSGGGGLLPISMPETSAGIAERRLAAHDRLGGGVLVTACASSLRRFRAQGERAVDIATVVEQSLGLKP